MNFKRSVLTAVVGFSIISTGCAAKATNAKEPAAPLSPIAVNIINQKGEKIGAATLSQLSKGVQVNVMASGLKPGMHGIHIHENGACETPDFKTSGAHFNPGQAAHGYDNPAGPHAGDMPNLVAGADGHGNAQFILPAATLQKGSPNSLLKSGGTSLIIHENADDMHTDPAGNSGGRIACGLIS